MQYYKKVCFSEKATMSYDPLINNIQFCYETFLDADLGISSAKKLKTKGVRGQMKKNKKAYGFYWIRAKDYENYLRVNLKE
jgi:hypothetical protein